MKSTDGAATQGEVEKDSTMISSSATPTINEKDPEHALAAPVETPVDYLTGAKLWAVACSVMLASFLVTMDVTILVTAIPSITSQFNSVPDIGWYGSAFMLTNCACQLSTGKIYQFYSMKYTFMSFITIFELGSLLCAVATSSKMFIVARAVAGIGGSGILNGGLTIIGTAGPPHKRPALLGAVFGVAMIGMIVGPLLGGALTEKTTWRWCFYINLPIGGVGLAFLSFIKIPSLHQNSETKPTLKEAILRLDPLGFILFCPACIMVLLAMQWGGVEYAWSSSVIIGLFVGFAATLLVFIAWEHHQGPARAMIPLSIIGLLPIASAALVQATNMGAIVVITYYLNIWFQVVLGASPIMAGVYFLASIGPQVLGGAVAATLTSKIGYYTPQAICGNVLGSIGAGLLSTLVPSSSTGEWVGYQVLAAFGRGLIIQQAITAVQNVLPRKEIPLGTAFIMFVQFFSGALMVSIAQTIFQSALGPALEEFAPNISKASILAVGATNVRGMISEADLPGVIRAYSKALTSTFYLSVGLQCVGVFVSFGMGFGKAQGKEKKPEATEKEVAEV